MDPCRKMTNMEDFSLNFKETELRLGLPGGDGETGKNSGKRGFSETVDLKLNLGTEMPRSPAGPATPTKESSVDLSEKKRSLAKESGVACGNDPGKPSAPKAQVVGWPPVRSFRKNILAVQKSNDESSVALVKVSMDGAPYLRKVDLKIYKSYQELSNALENMFSCFTIGMNGRDFLNESKLMDLLNGSDYVPTYEDKDGDWMLVGDVPWEMFVDSCKRLRIMKGSEAIGLAPRAVEKCKSRS